MKIDPAPPPPPGPQTAISANIEPSVPFEAFLRDDVAHGRAFGFAELGMFGRDRPAQGPVETASPQLPLAESTRASLPVESLDEPGQDGATPLPEPSPAPEEPAHRPTRTLAVPESRRHVSIDSGASGDAADGIETREIAQAEEGGESLSAISRPCSRVRTARSDVSLIIRQKEGAVELVAAGPALDLETRILLRRLARAILAGSGLDLAKFHLNGVPLTPDSENMIGGTHGTGTR